MMESKPIANEWDQFQNLLMNTSNVQQSEALLASQVNN